MIINVIIYYFGHHRNRPEFPDGAPNIADILYEYLMQRLNEFKAMLSAFFSTVSS